jgi:hypothetical protein
MRRGSGASCSQSLVGRAPVERYGFAWMRALRSAATSALRKQAKEQRRTSAVGRFKGSDAEETLTELPVRRSARCRAAT